MGTSEVVQQLQPNVVAICVAASAGGLMTQVVSPAHLNDVKDS